MIPSTMYVIFAALTLFGLCNWYRLTRNVRPSSPELTNRLDELSDALRAMTLEEKQRYALAVGQFLAQSGFSTEDVMKGMMRLGEQSMSHYDEGQEYESD